MKNRILSTFALAFLLIAAACGGKKEDGNDTGKGGDLSGEIRIDGSSTVYPITEAVAEEFQAVSPKVKVTIGLSGTGGGFKKFGRGEIDINNASKSMSAEQKKLAEENNITFVELSVAYDGLAVVVHPQNDWAKDITVAELKKLWEPEAQGKITKWSQIRAGWPDQEVHLYGPGVESGTYDYFTEAVVGKAHSSRGDYTGSEDDNVLVQGIAGDKYALGFFGFAYFQENKDKLKLVPVDNGNGAVAPSEETVKNKTYTPLSRPLFIYVSNKGAARNEVQEFVRFYLQNAGSLAGEVGYISLNDQEYQAELDKFEEFVKKSGQAK